MTKLNTAPNIARPDEVYAMLIEAHDGLTDAESRRLDAALILTLANQIGDQGVLADAVAAARQTTKAGQDVPSRDPPEDCPVRAVCEAYITAVAAGDGEGVRALFHDTAIMTGTLNGEFISGPAAPFFDHVTRTPQGPDYRAEITGIEVVGPAAIAVIRETGYSGMDFTNWFHLVQAGQGWVIASKLFAQKG